MMSDLQIETDKEKQNDENYWINFLEKIYLTETYSVSNDQLKSILDHVIISKDQILKHEPDYEPFYTFLMRLCLFEILENLNKYSIEQVNDLNQALEIFIEYLLKNRKELSDEPVLTLNQFFSLFDSLIRGQSYANDTVDSKTLVAMIKKTCIPKLETGATSLYKKIQTPNLIGKNSINSLLNTFLNFKSKSESVKPNESSPLQADRNPLELFKKNVLKHFNSNNGFEIFTNELESSLAYLNVYRKNHLKNLDDSSFKEVSLSKDEALHTKENLANLINDLKLLEKFVDFPLSKDSTLNQNWFQKLAQLVQASQIAVLQTCLADLMLYDDQAQSSEDSSHFTDLSTLVKQCTHIVDKFTSVSSDPTLLNKTLYVQSVYLSKLLEKQQEKLLNLKLRFDSKSSNDNQQLDNSTSLKYLTCNQFNQDLKAYFISYLSQLRNSNAPSTQKTFKTLFNLLHSTFLKTLLQSQNSKTANNNKLQIVQSDSVAPKQDIHELIHEIKNIDDPSLDTDDEDDDTIATNTTTYTSITNNQVNNNNEDGDDYLLIGSWLYDQINAPSNDQENQQAHTSDLNTINNNNNQLANISNSTQILDTTFDLDSSNHNKSFFGYVDLMVDVLELMEELSSRSVEMQNLLKESLTESEIKDLCSIMIDIESDDSLLPEKFLNSFYNFVQYLIVKNFLDHDKQSFVMDQLNLSKLYKEYIAEDTNLMINKRYLSIMCQIFVLRLTKSHTETECQAKTTIDIKYQIVQVWINFLKLMQIKIVTQTEQSIEDVSIEHASFLLFLFHNLPIDERKTILVKASDSLIEISKKIPTEQKKTSKPFLLSRLVLIFDYMLRYFDEPSHLLIKIVQINLLNLQTSQNQDSIDTQIMSEEEKFLNLHNPIAKPVFYVLTPKQSRVKQSVCDILYASVDYDQLYTSLIELAKFGSRITQADEKKIDRELVSISCNFNLIWSLLEPSLGESDAFLKVSSGFLRDLTKNLSASDSLELVQFSRLVLKLIKNKTQLDKFDDSSKLALVSLLGETRQIETQFVVSPQMLLDMITNQMASRLESGLSDLLNIDLLNYNLSIVKHLVDDQDAKHGLDLTRFKNALNDLIYSHKSFLKKEIILRQSLQLKTNEIEMFSLILSSSKSVLNQLNQLDHSVEPSFLINTASDSLFNDLNATVKTFNQNISKKEEISSSFKDLNINWFIPELKYSKLIKNMSSMLIDLKQNVDPVFLSLNGDLNVLPSLAENVNDYFKNEANLGPKISCFTFEIIYKSLTHYYLISDLDEPKYDQFLCNLLNTMSTILDTQQGMQGFLEYFHSSDSNSDHDQLTQIFNDQTSLIVKQSSIENSTKKFLLFLLTSVSSKASKSYFISQVAVLNKILSKQIGSCANKQITQLLVQLNHISNLDQEFIQKWLSKLVKSSSQSTESSLNHDKSTLHQLVIYLANETSVLNESVALSILNSLIQISNSLISSEADKSIDGQNFADLISLMDSLSSSGSGHGHLYLFQACAIWIEYFASNSSEIIKEDQQTHQNSICYILSYICQILAYLRPSNYKCLIETQTEIQKFYQDQLIIDFDQQTQKLFDLVSKKELENLYQDCDEQKQEMINDDETDANDTNIDDTCNDQDQDENYDLDENSDEDDYRDDYDEQEEDHDDQDEDDFDEQISSNHVEDEDEPTVNTRPPVSTQTSSSNSNTQQLASNLQSQNQIDINELFNAYGVTYQIFDESENMIRNENRIDDEMDEDDDAEDEEPDDDDEDDDDDEYGDDFTDNFIDYEHNPPTHAISTTGTNSATTNNRDAIYQDLISTISAAAAAINGRLNNQSNTTAQAPNPPSRPAAPSSSETKPAVVSKKSKTESEDLHSKLCTFTVTKKDFMNQHWYYCHTCEMVDRIGICSICAKVCHKDHDISYAKYGSFFCDCGAKEDGSCKALVKRNLVDKKSSIPSQKMAKKRTKLNSISSAQNMHKKDEQACDSGIELLKRLIGQIRANKPKQIEKLKPQIIECIRSKNLIKLTRDLLEGSLIPKAKETYENSLLKSNSRLAREDLLKLKSKPSVNLETESEQLFQVTLGSQEGAFENVRLTYTGDNGQLIKQLIQTHSLRRVSMCLVSSKKRKHLIVTHEKGKSSHLTILQLNALLKQDSNKRNKLTLTKLNTVPVPFTLISVVANQSNEDYVSLTGLKDCYVMYLNENGQTKNEIQQAPQPGTQKPTEAGSGDAAVTSNKPASVATTAPGNSGIIILHPSLEGSNYIIKSVWLPGSKTELALVTSEFIKIYDLSLDKISPVHYFLLPMGKIKDVTFVYHVNNDKTSTKQLKHIVIITSDGYLYYEELNDVTSAKNGVYYVTNTIDMSTGGQQQQQQQHGAGVSVYYSFKLKLLFWSHQQGKTFIGSLCKPSDQNQIVLDKVFQLNSPNANGNSNTSGQALCSWTEIPSHPGLVMAMTLITNNPVVFMFKPDKIYYQEIKLLSSSGAPSKAKIQDMVAIRHSSTNDQQEANKTESNESDVHTGLPLNKKEKTTMILLCDDGSLKIYVADTFKTDYWLQPYLRPTQPILQLKSTWPWSSASLYQLSPLTIKQVYKQSELQRKQKEKLKLEDLNNNQVKINERPASNPISTAKGLKRSNAVKSKTGCKKCCSTQFAIDYFEKCAQLDEIEYSGSDLLEIYNSQQLKIRLLHSNSQKFVLARKPQGFRLEITNTNESNRMLLMGCRVLCGSHSIEKSPLYFEVLNRKIPVKLTRARWFDICLTREEAFIADNKLSVLIGPSSDTSTHFTMIDAVLCYGKSKSELGWTKTEAAELLKKHQDKLSSNNKIASNNKEDSSGPHKPDLNDPSEIKKAVDLNLKKSTGLATTSLCLKMFNQHEAKPFDRLLSQSLDIYENCLLILNETEPESYKLGLDLISMICPPLVLYKSQSLLYNSLQSIQLYNSYKDDSVLNLVYETFFKQEDVDSEMLEKCLLICKSLIQEKREINLVKFLNDKFNSKSENKIQIISCLNSLFWSLVNRSLAKSSSSELNQIGEPSIQANLSLIIETLVDIEHSFLLVELNSSTINQFLNSNTLNLVVDSYLKLLLSDSLEINFTARKCILQLLKSSSKKSVISSTKAKPSDVVVPKANEDSDILLDEEEEELNENDQSSFNLESQATEDEMMQMAMALSLTEQTASASAPAVQPRTLAPKTKARKASIQSEQLNSNSNLLKLRKILLEKFCLKISEILKLNENLDGLKSVAFFQFILTLLSDISPREDFDKSLLDSLIQSVLDLLEPFTDSSIHLRTQQNEIKLIALRTISILLSKSKYQRSGTETCNFIIQNLIQHLLKFNLIDKCLQLLKFVLGDYWSKKSVSQSSEADRASSTLIKVSNEQVFYDELSPYFVKSDPLNKDSFIVPPPNLASIQSQDSALATPQSAINTPMMNQIDLFDNYIELLTEILIRLPYQMKKLCLGQSSSSSNDLISQIGLQFDFSSWTHYLCEYLLLPQCNFLKRLIKKLLQILCGSKEKYRKFKDQHILSTSINQLVSLCPLACNPSAQNVLSMGPTINEALDPLSVVNLPQLVNSTTTALSSFKISKTSYLSLTKIVDNLKLILEVAASRASNWQRFCLQNPTTIIYLIDLALIMGVDSNGSGSDSSNLQSSTTASLACTSVIVPTLLQLLLSLFGAAKTPTQPTQTLIKGSKPGEVKHHAKTAQSQSSEENLSYSLVSLLFKYVAKETILRLMRMFLLEAFQDSVRWSMHSLVYNLFKNSSNQNQDVLYEIMMTLWPEAMSIYGSKANQYVDILGYTVLKSVHGQVNLESSLKLKEFVSRLIDLFKHQNNALSSHPNSLIYETISLISDLDGFYLEPEPCFVCNNIEQPTQSIKLNSIKVDSRFTTSQQIYKLVTTHSVQKILIKITDIRKTKMIQSLNIYYTNRTSHSIVDLKMNMKLWSKAKQVHVEPGQTEIKIDLQLPIICSNLLLEYSDFYDRDSQTSSESAVLQCPRCSASVPANPGVCTTCGENVFQCHKCRAINYDERDPFLCNSCGFCKFAKFDITLVARQYSSVDPIECEEDRKQTLQNINTLLDRADKLYTFMSCEVRPVLEAMIIKLNEQNVLEKYTLTVPALPSTAAATGATQNPSGVIGTRMSALLTGGGQSAQPSTAANLKTVSLSVQKTAHSIVQKYAECKTKFEELSKIVLKVNLSRKELREYDKQFRSFGDASHHVMSSSRKNSIIVLDQSKEYKSSCFGCVSSSIEHCLTLLRVLICSNNTSLQNYVKSELCRNDILEEILNFNLKRNLSLISIIGNNQTTAPSPTQAPTTATSASNTTATQPATTAATPTQALNQTSGQKLFDRDLINLVFMLLKDNLEGSERFQRLVLKKVEQFLEQPNLSSSSLLIKNEMVLLSSLIQKLDDTCWEMRFRLVLHILLRSLNLASVKSSTKTTYLTSTKIIDELTLPCLRILFHLSKTSTSMSLLTNQLGKRQPASSLSSFNMGLNRFYSEPADTGFMSQSTQIFANLPKLSELDPNQFMNSKTSESFYEKWSMCAKSPEPQSFEEDAQALNEMRVKYFSAWRKYTLKKRKTNAMLSKSNSQTSAGPSPGICLSDFYEYDLKSNWLRICLFCPTNRAVRQLTSSLIQNLFQFYSSSQDQENARKFLIVDLIGENLAELTSNSDSHSDYLSLFKLVLSDKDSKYRFVIKHSILSKLDLYLQKEIKHLSDLERITELNSQLANLALNLSQGLSIKSLADLLSIFLKETNIRNKFKSRLIATVLNSYLSLKKLLFQRTKMIDEAQEKLLTTLELLTSGTEQESRRFMSICIDTVNNFELDDLVTPVFIFERLCNIIYPEEVVDNKEFLLILEKDPNQEDYLQGRMLGNPYSSNEPGLGPLMRNVKNKICTDSELIALLEDDNGMELLVQNKIISLDLSVRDVYKKVWLTECLSEHEPMRVVYRMTGLSGDATEDIIDNLEPKNADLAKNEEDIYRMADELAQNGALQVMLERLGSINQQNFTLGKPLLRVLLKLFDYSLKLKVNRAVLIKPELKTISTMLQTLNMMLNIEIEVSLAEKLINIMQVILAEASKQPQEIYNEFSSLCGDQEQLEFLLNNIKSKYVRSYPNLMQALMGLIPFLSFGDDAKMKSLIEYFSTFISNFDDIDTNTTTNEDLLHLECFCVIVNEIEIGENGKRLRDMMHSRGILQKAIDYLLKHSPQITTYLNSDFDLWKDFISRNSLPYVLRILTGLCRSHEIIQDAIGESCIPLLHKLEQFSSGNLVGILAEDLLVALKQNPSSKVAAAIEQVRTQTKNEKKKLAMAMRKKQLNQLGMRTNEKGQLLVNTDSLKNLDVEEEKGHICCICREGYKYHPQKVLAIYTFSKKVDLEPAYEAKARKTVGCSTVTHFNLVHIDCHTNAIRSARTCRDEWENAALQNANTKCNGILPIWGPEVTETLFSNALAKHNNYLLEATGIRDVNYILYVHDLKLMLNRFAENLSFSEDSGGGGRESNVNLIPHLIHAVLYSINTAKYVQREDRNLTSFLDQSEKLVSNSFECDNVFYYLAMSLVIMKPDDWKLNRIKFLNRTLLTCHARLVNNPATDKQKLNSLKILEFKKYKASLLFIGLVNLFFKHLHEKVKPIEQTWTETLASYIRNNDLGLMDCCKVILKEFEEELFVCEDWMEMFDVLGYLQDVNEPVEYLKNYLQSVSK